MDSRNWLGESINNSLYTISRLYDPQGIRNHTEPYGTIRNHTGPYGTIRDHTEPYGCLSDPYRSIP